MKNFGTQCSVIYNVQNVLVKKEKMSMIIRHLLASTITIYWWKYSTDSTSCQQWSTFNLWWNYTWHFSLYDRTNYPQGAQDKKKVRSRCVPYQQRVKLCRENLAKLQNGSCRLCDIITGDKTYGDWWQVKELDLPWREGEWAITVVRRSKKVLFYFL